MDHHDLLYSNKFIPHPLANRNGTTSVSENTLRQYNQYSKQRVMNKKQTERQSRRTMFTEQLKTAKKIQQLNNIYLKRTSITIDSTYRQKVPKILTQTLFSGYFSSSQIEKNRMQILRENENIIFKIGFKLHDLSSYQKDMIYKEKTRGISIILEGVPSFPVYPYVTSFEQLQNIPLHHINFDEDTG